MKKTRTQRLRMLEDIVSGAWTLGIAGTVLIAMVIPSLWGILAMIVITFAFPLAFPPIMEWLEGDGLEKFEAGCLWINYGICTLLAEFPSGYSENLDRS